MNEKNEAQFQVEGDFVRLEDYTAPPPAPSKPKRVAKKTREALQREFDRGYSEALERDKGLEMMGTLGVAIIFAAIGAGLGAWLF